MKKILFSIGLTLLLTPPSIPTHAGDFSKVQGDFFNLNQRNNVTIKKAIKPVHKTKQRIKLLRASFSVSCIAVMSLGIYKWYVSSNAGDENEGHTPEGNTASNPQDLSRYHKIYSQILMGSKLGECPYCLNNVRILPFCSIKHPYCAHCSYEWITTDKQICPTCSKPFKQEVIELIKGINQCYQINYKGILVWVNKDFVWLEDICLKDYPKDEGEYTCGGCNKKRPDRITFLLCGCEKNPLCIACWKKNLHDSHYYTNTYRCPSCKFNVSKWKITFVQKCCDDPRDGNTHPILMVQNALKQGNSNRANVDIRDRKDSIQAWIDEKKNE